MGRALLPLAAIALLCAGCSLTRPPATVAPATAAVPPSGGVDRLATAPTRGAQVLGLAAGLVGIPYRFGGRSPLEGFDCSGLVWHVHQTAGLAVPRTARDQYGAARPVARSALQPGDLVFFSSNRRGSVDHVGIYAGDGRFLHAPRSGRPVGYERLDTDWFATHFVGAGRLWDPGPGGGS
ncbi:MAG: C40 family peptidase [Steroidobacteraceae bacterium]|nr:C40 family peptidase [Nevskiaceae bacterium]MCP5339945.1 C40 family peptidase [Nevskiaceae bacterium]